MINTIIVAIDGSEPGQKALAFATELAAKHQARIVLAHVLLRTATLDDLYAAAEHLGFTAAVKTDLEELEDEAASMAMGHAGPMPVVVPDEILKKIGELILENSKATISDQARRVETQMMEGDPAAAIVASVDKESADLVVVGSRGFGRVKGLLLGSVSQKVAQDAPCACLIVK